MLNEGDVPPYAERQEWQHALVGFAYSIGWIVRQLQRLNNWLKG